VKEAIVRKLQRFSLAIALATSAALLLALSSADARGGEKTLKATGTVVGGLVKIGFFGADGVPGPRKVELTVAGKQIGTMSLTGTTAAGHSGCSASPFFRCGGRLTLKAIKDVSTFEVTFANSSGNPGKNAFGRGEMIFHSNSTNPDVNPNEVIGTIEVMTPFKQFATANGRFPVVIKLNSAAR
jgi:hypothetical protein